MIASISRTRPILRAGLVLVLCLYGAYQGHRNHLFYRGSLDDMRRAAELVELETFETRPVYADLWGARLLNLLIPDGTRVQVLNRIESVPDGAVVILGGARGYDLTPEEAMSGASDEIVAIHLGLAQPPSHWTEILRHRGERLIQRSSDLVAFQVSEAQPENAPAGPEKELDADEDFH